MKITEESMKQQQEPASAPKTTSPTPEPPQPTEREKLKAMSRRDRVWYIWEYYKFHMLAVVVVVFLVYVAASSFYRSTFNTALHCIYVNSRSESGVNFAPLEEDFAAWLELGKKDVITTETLFISYGDDATNYSYANMAKITALVSTSDLDVMVCDQENLDHYGEMDGFLDLEQTLSPDVLALVENRLYRCSGSDGLSHAYAIDISGTSFAANSQLAQTPPLLGVVSTTVRLETVEALIRYIFAP